MSNYILINGELYHHGIKGMKWGRRRYQNADGSLTPAGRKRYDASTAEGRMNLAKDKYKTANKEYSKAYDRAYNRSIAGLSPIKKHREANDRRWNDAYDKAEAANAAHDAYKSAKKEYKQERKQLREQEKAQINKVYTDINRNTKFGEKLVYNEATRKAAAKYVVKNNMTLEEARKKANSEARRNTAAIVAGYGAITLAAIYASK